MLLVRGTAVSASIALERVIQKNPDGLGGAAIVSLDGLGGGLRGQDSRMDSEGKHARNIGWRRNRHRWSFDG